MSVNFPMSVNSAFLALCIGLCASPSFAVVLNNPYPAADADKKIFYSSFSEQPKTLDPARSYSSNEYLFIGQIYEPLLQYDYFIRPYQLTSLTTTTMPTVEPLNKNGEPLKSPADAVGYTRYKIEIKKGIYYQPHPAFAQDAQGKPLYMGITEDYLKREGIYQLADFAFTATRELKADDYLYQIKRLATPRIQSPIYGLMSEHILGFANFKTQLPKNIVAQGFLDLVE